MPTSHISLIRTEKLLKVPLNTENGLKVKFKTHMTILDGSNQDLTQFMIHLYNLMLPDVKLTNFLSNNSKNIKMLLMLSLSLELN